MAANAIANNNVFFMAVFQLVVSLYWEVNTDAVKQHHRGFLIRLWNIRTFTHFGSKTYLELKHFWCPEGVDRAK